MKRWRRFWPSRKARSWVAEMGGVLLLAGAAGWGIHPLAGVGLLGLYLVIIANTGGE